MSSASRWSAARAPRCALAPDEYRIKAAFLYNFGRYGKWPEPTFKDREAPLRIAVIASEAFGKVLEHLIEHKKAGTHPALTANFASAQELGERQFLYVPSSEEKNLAQIKRACKDKSVLVVDDSLEVAEHGTQVGFHLDKAKVRFAINTDAVRLAKLEVSTELLELARVIEEGK